MLYDNPHCVEFFCKINNVVDCKKCYNKLKNKIKLLNEKDLENQQINKSNDDYCKNKCTEGYFYDFITDKTESDDKYKTTLIDKYKNKNDFNYKNKVYKYTDITYEYTIPKPKTVVH